ncbi:MAG: hypothetical protein D6732_06760 [Methanobacteriota archaeon]|nr:MAG: hypothetical protein D6732_06760 [Euryarchaeota archaeon]
MNEKFYVLKPVGLRFGTKFAYGEQVHPIQTGDFARCPVCGHPVTARKWLSPRKIKLSTSQKSKWGDFVWGDGFTLVVSERFAQLYKNGNLHGISSFQAVNIVKTGQKNSAVEQPKYYLIDFDWNGANLDDEKSGIIRNNIKCAFCRASIIKSFNRVVIETNSWKGADIFGVRGLPGEILVSEKTKLLIESFKLTGAIVVPSERYSYDQFSGWSICN